MDNIHTKEVSKDTVRSHVEKNTIEVVPGRKCVDGGYTEVQSPGMIARPGADLGYVMALMLVSKELGLGLTSKDCFDIVYDAVIKNGEKFYIHTDQHSDHGRGIIGCGHALKSSLPDYSQNYGLNPTEVFEMLTYAVEKAKTDNNIENIHLDREHQELGILRIKGTKKTVNPWDKDDNTMFFVYDEERDNDYLRLLTSAIEKKEITYENLKNASDKQLLATLRILALGKPIFDINLDDGKKEVSFSGNVE